MTYTFHENTDLNLFDDFVIHSDQNSLFQNTKWAEVKDNWDHLYTSVTKEGEMVGAALVLIRSLPLGMTLFYVPRGPVMDYSNHELVSFFLENLKTLAKKRKAIALRFDPALLSRVYPYTEHKEDHEYMNNDVIEYLKSLGAVHSGFTTYIEESTQPRYNAAMPITENVRGTVSRKVIKRIERAEQSGVRVLEGHEYLDDFAAAMHYTEVRKGVALRNREYFKHMMEIYGDHCICLVSRLNVKEEYDRIASSIKEREELLAGEDVSRKQRRLNEEALANEKKELEKISENLKTETEDDVVTCGVLAVYNERLMEIFYMGNHPNYLRTFSSYLLYETLIERCETLGIERCSFGGIEGTLDDGLTAFKSNWPMEVEEYIGEFNFVLNPVVYKGFSEVYPKMLKLAAKMRGKS